MAAILVVELSYLQVLCVVFSSLTSLLQVRRYTCMLCVDLYHCMAMYDTDISMYGYVWYRYIDVWLCMIPIYWCMALYDTDISVYGYVWHRYINVWLCMMDICFEVSPTLFLSCYRRLLESERRSTELMEMLAKKEEALQRSQVCLWCLRSHTRLYHQDKTAE